MKLPKKYKPLAFALAALILVGAAYALIVLLIPEPPEEPEKDITAGYTTLVDYELKNLDHVDFRFADGYEYTIKLTHKSDVSRSYSIVGKEEYDYDFTSISSACLSLSGISSSRLVEENAQDLAKYGFDEPQANVMIYGTDGTSVKLTVGDATGVGEYSYVIKDDGDDVYLISSYSTRYLISKDFYYRKKDIFTLNEEDPSADVQAIQVSKNGEMLFDYVTLTEEERDALDPDLDTLAYMYAPVEHSVNTTTLSDYLLSNMMNVNFNDVVEDRPTDLAQYGLDSDTLNLKVTLSDGTTSNIMLGDVTEDGSQYGMLGGVNSILLFDEDDFAFLNDFDFSRLIYRLIWTYNIQELSGFDVTAHGVTHSVELFDPDKDEEEAGEEFWATFDGKELREENCRRLYIRVLSPSVYNLTDEQMNAAAEPESEWSCNIHFDTGRSDETISFHKINARQYAAYRNGEPTGFFVNINDLEAIDEALDIIAKGDLIPG